MHKRENAVLTGLVLAAALAFVVWLFWVMSSTETMTIGSRFIFENRPA